MQTRLSSPFLVGMAFLASVLAASQAAGAPSPVASIAVSVYLGTTTPTIACSPTSFSVQSPEGGAPSSRTLLVWNGSQQGVLNYTIATSPTCLVCTPTTGSSTGQPTTHTITIRPAGLNARDYAGTITISAQGRTSTRTLPLALRVNDVVPRATITSIAPNPVQPPGAIVSFAGASSDAAGRTVAHQWRSNLDGLLNTQTSFNLSSNQLTVGNHTIAFTAWDDEGSSATQTRLLTVRNALSTATILSMTPNPAQAGSTITVTLAGQDNDERGGTIVDGQLTWPDGVRTGIRPGLHRLPAPRTGGQYIVQYRVRDDEGTWSATTSRSLSVAAVPAPTVAAEPTYTAGTTNRISWNAVGGASAYFVQWSTKASFAPLAGSSDWITSTTRLVAGLADGQAYFYRVKSRNAYLAESSWSNVVQSTQDAAPPSVPGRPADAGAFTSSTTVRFTWTASTDGGSGVGSYDLQVGTQPGGANLFNRNVGNVLTQTIPAADGQTLYARVCAGDKVGNSSAWSANSDGITVDTAPPRLTAVTSQDYGTLRVTFNEPVRGADQAGNYSCTGRLNILSVTPLGNAQYILRTSDQVPKTSYTLTVRSAVSDRAGNRIVPPYSSRAFSGGILTSAQRWYIYR